VAFTFPISVQTFKVWADDKMATEQKDVSNINYQFIYKNEIILHIVNVDDLVVCWN
jgi:hypothetical protein